MTDSTYSADAPELDTTDAYDHYDISRDSHHSRRLRPREKEACENDSTGRAPSLGSFTDREILS